MGLGTITLYEVRCDAAGCAVRLDTDVEGYGFRTEAAARDDWIDGCGGIAVLVDGLEFFYCEFHHPDPVPDVQQPSAPIPGDTPFDLAALTAGSTP